MHYYYNSCLHFVIVTLGLSSGDGTSQGPQPSGSIVEFDLKIRLYTLCNFTKHTPHTSGSVFIKPKQM